MIPYNIGMLGNEPTTDTPQAATDWFSANAPTPATGGVTGGQPTGNGSGLATDASAQDFGNLSDPRQWDALVQNPDRLKAWIKSQNPGWNDQLVGYYAGVIQKQPGASDAEKAGSADYYINQKFKKDPFYGGQYGASGGATDSTNIGAFGSLAQPWTKAFKAPTIADLENPDSPQYAGYQFAKKEGLGALDTSAAARGTLLNGGQQKDRMAYATGLANQYGQQQYQNALNEYAQQYDIFRSNGNDIFNRFNTLAGAGTSAAGAATS